MSAVLFGSISTLADTSELQREAFNEAFAQHGLSWRWDREEYAALLEKSGGSDRVDGYATARGESVDAAAVHASKSRIFQERLTSRGVEPRSGVVDTIKAAREAGISVGLITTTSTDNVEALLGALRAHDLPDFDLVLDSGQVDEPKPDPAAYVEALERLDESAENCLAIEDNVGGLEAASGALIACVAFPNVNTVEHSFDGAAARVDHLDLDTLRAHFG